MGKTADYSDRHRLMDIVKSATTATTATTAAIVTAATIALQRSPSGCDNLTLVPPLFDRATLSRSCPAAGITSAGTRTSPPACDATSTRRRSSSVSRDVPRPSVSRERERESKRVRGQARQVSEGSGARGAERVERRVWEHCDAGSVGSTRGSLTHWDYAPSTRSNLTASCCVSVHGPPASSHGDGARC